MTPQTRGAVALGLAGVLFGSTFLVVSSAIETVEPTPFLGARFLLAALVLAPLARSRPSTGGEVPMGILAGAVLAAGYLLQTFGLRTTLSSTSAFITYLLVVIVPVVVAVRERRAPESRVVVGVAVAVAGLYLLSGGASGRMDRGELLTLACALAFAVHLILVGNGATRFDPVRFTFVQILTVAVLCGVPGFWLGGYDLGARGWAAVVFTGVFATALAFMGMVVGQRTVPETKAAILLLVEPVSAGLLGMAAGEELGWSGVAGAVLIMVAVAVVATRPRPLGSRRPFLLMPSLRAEDS